jgi:hypothetical protein
LRPLRLAAFLVLATAVGGNGCRRGDPVKAALDGVVRAVETKSPDDLPRFLTADYRDQEGWTPADVTAFVKRYVAGYDTLKIALSRLEIEKGEGVARAQFRAELSGTPKNLPALEGLLPRSSKYDFLVMLSQEKDGWKVSSARWTPAP